jgi:hypothetical protein
MATAEIGALHVDLSMNAGTFRRASEQVQGSVRNMQKSFSDLSAKAVAAGVAVAAAVAGLVMGIKGAVDRADELDELAQKIGITVQALSELAYGSQIAGVPLDKLTAGVTKFSLELQKIAQGDDMSAASRALTAMGVAATTANGALVPTEELLLRVAESFAGMRDGAEKTAIAMNLFGKSGAQIIPFLNAGRAGIEEWRKEADQFNLSIGADAAAAAGSLNEQIDKLIAIGQGFFNVVAQKLTPGLTTLLEKFVNLQKEMNITKGVAELLTLPFRGFMAAVMMVSTLVNVLARDLETLYNAMKSFASFNFTEGMQKWREGMAESRAEIDATSAAITRMFHEAAGPPPAPAAGGGGEGNEPPAVTSAKAIAEAKSLENAAMAEGKRILEETQTPLEAMIAKQHELTKLFAQGAISAKVYGRAMADASAFSAKNMDALASSVSSNLSTIFGDTKAVAIATALINTYQGVTKALATYPPPLAQIMAGIQLAAGMAQVANIRKQTKSGGGGGGGTGGEAGAAGAAAATQSPQQLFVQGINPSQMFSGDVVRDLANKLIQYQKDGGQVVIL